LKSFKLVGMTLGAFLVLGACASDTEQTGPIEEGFTLIEADKDRGVSATYRAGDVALRLQSKVVGDNVEARVTTEDGRVLTQLTVPLGDDTKVGSSLGPLARASANAQIKSGLNMTPSAMVPAYMDALQALHGATKDLDRSTVRFAIFWQYEVLIRMLPADPNANASVDTDWDDSVYDLDGKGEFVHTNLIYSANVRSFQAQPAPDAAAAKCDLGCSWYDVCCHHDEACVNCDRWYCSRWCVPGCFGGDCGGGR